MSQKPRVLLVGLLPGLSAMHLPSHLARVGMDVWFAGSDKCVLANSGFLSKLLLLKTEHYTYAQLISCIELSEPQWIVPIDDTATAALQAIATGISGVPNSDKTASPSVLALLKRSLGYSGGYCYKNVRAFMAVKAAQAGIDCAEQTTVTKDLSSVRAFVTEHGFPVVFKREGSSAGFGVHILDDEPALVSFLASDEFAAQAYQWVIQKYVPGSLGMHTVFASEGRVHAELSAVQVQRRVNRESAPSSVIRLIEHTGMRLAARRFIGVTGASGFHSWDFKLDEEDQAVMIEYNPRPIALSHLGVLTGQDLCVAFARQFGETVVSPRSAAVFKERTVALFPEEWWRDSSSPWLVDATHDVPWSDHKLLQKIFSNLKQPTA